MTETATEITAAGYANLGIGTACAAWAFIELQDNEATPRKIMRIANNDSRVAAVEGFPTTKKMKYIISLSGANAEVTAYMSTYSTTACTFAKCLFKNLDTDGADVLAADTFTPATISSTGDTLSITVEVGVGAGEA